MAEIPTYRINDGQAIPVIGFGTHQLTGENGIESIVNAIDAGYRLLDTAVNYDNEEEVGEAIRRSGVDRDEFVVCSKIPGRHHGYDDAMASIRGSLQRLGLDRLDLQLIHWPNPRVGRYPEAWRALVDAREQGLVTSIGVSNFTAEHLDRIIDDTGVPPVVNQIELHPYFPQERMRATNEERGVRTESWSPLGKRRAPFDEPPVAKAAERYGVTPSQVILRWQIHLGAVPIPKSARPQRQRENLDVFGFDLSADEVAAISALGSTNGRLFGGDPDSHEEM